MYVKILKFQLINKILSHTSLLILTKLIAIDFVLYLQHKAMHLIMHEIAFGINVTHSFEHCTMANLNIKFHI